MISGKILRYVLIPSAVVITDRGKDQNDCVCKPSELPIYTSEPAQPTTKQEPPMSTNEPGRIEQAIGTIRQNIFSCLSELKTIEHVGKEYIQIGYENASHLIAYLQEEENLAPKYGAVAVGGLSGFIFGLRGGMFRKLIYTSTGALSMAAICYPKEASQYLAAGIKEAQKYFTIAYNFINGVKKDDPPLEFPSLPNLPKSFSEAWDATKNFGKSSSASSVLGDKQEKEGVKNVEK